MGMQKRISLESVVLDNARFDFDSVLNRTLAEMVRLGVMTGTVTMKVGIELTPVGEVGTGRAMILPKITHKVSANMKLSGGEEAGCAETAGCELAIDDTTGEPYLVRIDDGQTCLMEEN